MRYMPKNKNIPVDSLPDESIKPVSKEYGNIKVDYVWYAEIKSCLFDPDTDISDRTFLKIFFSPALYSCYLREYIESTTEEFSKKNFDDDFYLKSDSIKSYYSMDKLERSVSMMSTKNVIAQLSKKISDIIDDIADSFITKGENNCKLFDVYGHMTIANKPEKYEADIIYNEYHDHSDFYIRYLKIILKCLDKKGIDTKKMIKNIHSSLNQQYSFKSITPRKDENNEDNTYHNFACYLYNYILICTEHEHSFKTDILSRFRIGVDPDVQTELCNYVSVIEHYPVNSFERLAALSELAKQNNLYAAQDLYFIYSHDITLYSADGMHKYFMKSDANKSEFYYDMIQKSSEKQYFHNVIFHHDKNYVSELFVPSLVKKYRMEYKNYDRTQIEKVMYHLSELYNNRLHPVDLDLLFFMNSVFEENDFLQEPQKLQLDYFKIRDYFHMNPWTERFKLPDMEKLPDKLKIGLSDFCDLVANMSDLSLHDILFNIIKYVRETGDKELEAVCRRIVGDNKNILEEALSKAKKKYSECNDKIFDMSDGAEKDELEINQLIWKKVGYIIRKVINN